MWIPLDKFHELLVRRLIRQDRVPLCCRIDPSFFTLKYKVLLQIQSKLYSSTSWIKFKSTEVFISSINWIKAAIFIIYLSMIIIRVYLKLKKKCVINADFYSPLLLYLSWLACYVKGFEFWSISCITESIGTIIINSLTKTSKK